MAGDDPIWNQQVTRTPTLTEAMDAHIERVLAECGGNISEAARRLGVQRSTVQRWRRRRAAISADAGSGLGT